MHYLKASPTNITGCVLFTTTPEMMALLSCVFQKDDRPSGRKIIAGTGARMKMDLQAGKESDYF